MSGALHVFAGPSLPPSAQVQAGIVFHGPAAQGDLYALVAAAPLAIGIVDGYFERVPAVWHKEILWALSHGVHVFGAGSMGALRAVELADFGMVGVGEVFRQFAAGILNDDDELTVVHAERSEDYRGGSEAMVNVRATLTRAREVGLLSQGEEAALVDRTKRRFYPDRSYAAVLDDARALLGAPVADELRAWLSHRENRVDLKRLDALELVRVLIELQASTPAPKLVPWTFNRTDAWEQVRLRLTGHPERTEPRPRPGMEGFNTAT